MPVDPTEHYKLILQQHNHASDFRLKIIYGWGWSYAGLAITFNWVYRKVPELSWIVPAVGIVITWLVWLFDERNRHGLASWRSIGKAFEDDEKENHVPKNQSYFNKFTKGGGSHGLLIDTASAVIITVLAILTIWLLWFLGNFYPGQWLMVRLIKWSITLLVWGAVWLCWKKRSSLQQKTRKVWKWLFYVIRISLVGGGLFFGVIGSFPLTQSKPDPSVGLVIILLNLIPAIWFYVDRDRRRCVDKPTLEKMIREKAYFIWENKGKQPGKDMENWLEAEEDIKENFRSQK